MTPVRTVWHGLLAAGAYLSVASAPTLAQSQQTTPPAQSSGNSVIYLNQAWSQDDREWYYHFSQGSAVLSYDIFLNLEAADSQELFRSGLNSPRYGMVPEAANPDNPDGLPIGISKTVVATAIKGWPAGDYAGLTCAGCHEGQLKYKGKVIRIEGGISQTFDFQAMARGMDDALRATLTDPAKFDRLAARLGASTADAKDKLRQRIESEKRSGARVFSPNLAHSAPVGSRTRRCAHDDCRSLDRHVDGNYPELAGGHRASEAALPLECAARIVGAVERLCAGPDCSKFWRDDGRIPAR